MTTRRLGIPVIVALLVATVIGPARAAEPRATLRTVTIPAAAFTPHDFDTPYTKSTITLVTEAGGAYFLAPVFFEAPQVTVRKVTFYAIDAGISFLTLGLYRVNPATGVAEQMGETATVGSSWDIQEVTMSDLSPRRITGTYAAVLWIRLPDTFANGYKFLGARVTYSY